MALAVKRTGTILKKCYGSSHRLNSNSRCTSGECQHTRCDVSGGECTHAAIAVTICKGRE